MTWEWTLLRAGAFKLDGGAMFGMIPRPVWTRSVTPDDKNRIPLQTNCLLLQRQGKTVVVEAGIGDKMSDKLRGLYDAQHRSIEDAVRDTGVDPADVDAVIITHLHFDHAGGLTRLPRDNEQGIAKHNAMLTFPNAEVIVQQREWEDARANRSTMHSTYLSDHLDPIADHIRTVQGDCEVLPGIRVRPIPGHTWGQQAVLFEQTGGNTIAFPADLIPTQHHVATTWGMSYDVESYTSMIQKRDFLRDACQHQWTLALDHEPGDALFRVAPHETRQDEHILLPTSKN